MNSKDEKLLREFVRKTFVAKMLQEEKEKFLQEQLTQLEQQEKTIAKELTDKYGKGSLDIETGNFSPLE